MRTRMTMMMMNSESERRIEHLRKATKAISAARETLLDAIVEAECASDWLASELRHSDNRFTADEVAALSERLADAHLRVVKLGIGALVEELDDACNMSEDRLRRRAS